MTAMASVENMTPSEVLDALREFFPTFEARSVAIMERRSEMIRAGRPFGSIAAATELLRYLRGDRWE